MFIENHQFIGRSVVLTRKMELLVAASAIKLSFGLNDFLYRVFKTIIIYPTIYPSTVTGKLHKGESNPKLGVIVFAWDCFLEGLQQHKARLHQHQ